MKLGKNWSWLLLIIAFFLAPFFLRSNFYYLSVFTLIIINVLATSSLRTIAITGQMNVGVMAFMGIGAYMSAQLMAKVSFPIWAAMPLAGLGAMAVAAAISYPSVRVTGMYFAMVTLFFNQVMILIFTVWTPVTGGSTGLLNIPSIGHFSFLGLKIDFGHPLPYAYFALAITLICLLFLYRVEHSHLGKTLGSIAQDESAAKSVGINVTWLKVYSFCIGSFFVGIAGSLYAHYLRVINPDSFGMFPSIYLLIYMVFGGRARFIGPIIGAVVLTLIPQVFSAMRQYQPFLYVAALYLVLYLMPNGVADLPNVIKSLYYKNRERRVSNA